MGHFDSVDSTISPHPSHTTGFFILLTFSRCAFMNSGSNSFFASALISLWQVGHAIFIMADSSTLTAGLVISAQENIKGAAMGLHSLMGFGGGLLGPAIFGFVLDISGSRTSQVAWVWACVAVVMWGVLFVIYERHRGWGSSRAHE